MEETTAVYIHHFIRFNIIKTFQTMDHNTSINNGTSEASVALLGLQRAGRQERVVGGGVGSTMNKLFLNMQYIALIF